MNIRLLIIITLFLLSLLVRLTYYYCNPVQWRDSGLYKDMVEQWETNGAYPSKDKYGQENTIPPFPIFLFMISHKVSGNSFYLSNTALQIVLGSALICVLWGILSELRIKCIYAVIICIMAVFNKNLLDYSTQITRDNLYLLLCALFFYYAIKTIKNKSVFYSAFSGVLLAFTFLTRYEGIEFLLIFPLVLIMERTIKLKHKILLSSFFSSFFFLVVIFTIRAITPEYIYTVALTNKFLPYINVFGN